MTLLVPSVHESQETISLSPPPPAPGEAGLSPTSMLLTLGTAAESLCQVRGHGPRSEGQGDTLREIL